MLCRAHIVQCPCSAHAAFRKVASLHSLVQKIETEPSPEPRVVQCGRWEKFWFVYRMVKLISSIGESFYNFRPGHPGRSWRTRSWKSWALNVYHCSQWKMHCNCILVEALNQIIRHNQTQDSFEVKARSRWWRSHSPHHSEAKDKSPKAQI